MTDTRPSGIGLHVLFDAVSTDTEIGKLVSFCDQLRPAVLNIVGAARRDQAFAVAKALQTRYPYCRVIFRVWPDDGNWVKDVYRDPANWVRMARPFLESGLTVLADNESITDDLHAYSDWHATIMDLCGVQGWRVAVGRFATGNPRENQYGQLRTMYQALHRWGDLHVLSPNEYQSQRSLPAATPGHTLRLGHMLAEIKTLGLRTPQVSVGEWGLAFEQPGGYLDPGVSWRAVQAYPGRQYAVDLIDLYRRYYQPLGISVAIYCWGDSLGREWRSFRVDQDSEFQSVILGNVNSGRLALPASAGPFGPRQGYYRRVVLPRGNTYVNLRERPSSAGNVRIIGKLTQGDLVEIVGEQVDMAGILWYKTIGGWVSTQGKRGSPRIKFVPA